MNNKQKLLNLICNSKLLSIAQLDKPDCEKMTTLFAEEKNDVYEFIEGFDHKLWNVTPKLLASFFNEVKQGKPPVKLIERKIRRKPKHIRKLNRHSGDYERIRDIKDDVESLNPNDQITMYHGSNKKHACAMAKYGIFGNVSPPYRNFPGERRDPGVYSSLDPNTSASFGHCVLKFETKARSLHPPFWYYVDAWEGGKERMKRIENSYAELHPKSWNPMLTDSLLGVERQALFYGYTKPVAGVCKLRELITDDEFLSIEEFIERECK